MDGFQKHVGVRTDGMWQKPNYDKTSEKGSQQPTRFNIHPKERTAEQRSSVPVLHYGPSVRYWRTVANDIYAVSRPQPHV
jgi:hypothetical protein